MRRNSTGADVTKKERILEAYVEIVGAVPYRLLPKVVAAKVGTTASYVRTVARQRMGRGASEHDQRYNSSPMGKARFRRKWEAIKADPMRLAAGRATAKRYRQRKQAEARA